MSKLQRLERRYIHQTQTPKEVNIDQNTNFQVSVTRRKYAEKCAYPVVYICSSLDKSENRKGTRKSHAGLVASTTALDLKPTLSRTNTYCFSRTASETDLLPALRDAIDQNMLINICIRGGGVYLSRESWNVHARYSSSIFYNDFEVLKFDHCHCIECNIEQD